MDFVRDHTPVRFGWVPHTPTTTPRPRADARWTQRRAGPARRPDRRGGSRAAPPAVQQGAREPGGDAGELPLAALGLRPAQGPVATPKVFLRRFLAGLRRRRMLRHGQRPHDRAPQGADGSDVPVWYGTGLTELFLEMTGCRCHGGAGRLSTTGPRPSRRDARAAAGSSTTSRCGRSTSPPPSLSTGPRAPRPTPGAASSRASRPGRDRPHGRRLVGPTSGFPAARGSVSPSATCPGRSWSTARRYRFVNEAAAYVDAVHAMYAGEATGASSRAVLDGARPAVPQPLPLRGARASTAVPGPVDGDGDVVRSDTVEGSPRRSGSRPLALSPRSTASTGSPAPGVDEDFHRGESIIDKYYSDPTVKPNPSLHAIDQAPFYAVRIVPGDLGTKGGLRHRSSGTGDPSGRFRGGRALRRRQLSAAVMGRTYPGPGGTIGPALTFGYLAALDLAGTQQVAQGQVPIDPARRSAPSCPPVLLVDRVRRAALPPRRWASGPGRRPLDPATLALHHRGRHRWAGPGAAVVRHRAPTFHDTAAPSSGCRAWTSHLGQVVHGSQAIRSTDRSRPRAEAIVPTRISDVWDKGKAAVIVQEGPRSTRRRPAVHDHEQHLRARRGRIRWGTRSFDHGAAPRSGARPRLDVRPSHRSRRCSTDSAATATRCTPTPPSPRGPASPRRSCTGSAPTGSCCAGGPGVARLRRGTVWRLLRPLRRVVLPGESIRIRRLGRGRDDPRLGDGLLRGREPRRRAGPRGLRADSRLRVLTGSRRGSLSRPPRLPLQSTPVAPSRQDAPARGRGVP